MRVGLFIDMWDPLINGVITSVKELQKGLEKLGVETYIITGGKVDKPTLEGNIVFLPCKEFKVWNSSIINWLSPENRRFVSSLNLDLVHSHLEGATGFLASAIAKENNIPHVSTWHTCYYDYKHYVLYNFLYAETIIEKIAAHKYCGHKVEAVIAPSEKIANHLTKKLKIYHTPHIIKTGIDMCTQEIDKEELDKLKAELGIAQTDFVLSYVGRLAKEKNIKFLLEAQIALNLVDNNIKLLIVGDGPQQKELEEYAKTLQISDSVIFVGKKPHSELNKYYQISDINVNASTTESQGLTVLEALQNGVPVCCINDSAYNYIIKNNYNGLIFSNISEYLNAIITLKQNDNLEHMKKNAIKSGREYNNIDYAKSVLQVYKESLEKHRIKQYKR